MQVRVLGTLEVGTPDRTVPVPGAMRRRLLAVLTLTPGREMSAGELVEALWGDAATPSSPGTLQAHVARLRHDLPDPAVLATGPRGYLLAVGTDDVDATRFATLASRGSRLLAAGDTRAASDVLSEALALWRGPAYGEFEGVPRLEAEAVRLEALRTDVSEWLLAAQLGLSHGPAPVAALEAFVQAHPMRESAWALLVRALYRSGRRADALASFRRARDLLARELGVEPGRDLRELEEQVLRQDPALDAAPVAPPVRTGTPGPAELRPVSVVTFAQHGAHAAADVLRDVVVDLAVLHGASARLGVDPRLVAVLGWPAAHEDDPERAVRLALAVLQEAADRGLAAAAGVATGRVSGTGDLPPIGAPLVESAGLAHRADEGRLLVDAPTRERVAHLVEAVDAGDGTAEVVRLRLPSPGPRTLSATRFVGRARDLATLRAAFDQTVGDRRTHLVTVVAEAGVGKSRLVQEFAASVVDVCTWRTGHCRPYGDQVAYEPLLQVVRRHAGIDPSHVASEDRSDRLSDIRSELRGKLLAVLPPADGELVADRLAPLLGGPTDLAPSKGEAQRALRLVLQSMAHGGPAVLHLEDVHWAAPPLLDLLDQLVADPEPVPLLVLTTARPELFRHRPGWGSGEAPGTTLVLAPLDERETLSLLESLSTGDADREELARRSGGNPFFAEELARAAQHPDGAPTAALDALVEARLDALPDDQRALLLAASVAGHQFSAVQVAGLVGRDPDDVAEQLSALVRKQFLRRATTGGRPGAGLEFVHDLVEHTAYARLLPDTRARHHLAVAGFWRGPDGRGLAAHADLVAHHELTAHEAALDGHDVVLAETARGQAAQSALEAGVRVQGFDTTTARRLLARVMELTEPGSDDHAVALLRLAGVEFDAGDFGRARELLLPALAHFDGRDDELFTDAVLYWATVLFALGEPLDDAAEANRRALERMAPSRSLVRGLGLEGMIHLVRQTTESMRRTLQVSARAIAVDEQTGCGGSGFAHVLHGRARVALGDEGGLDELEAWLDDVERHELASLAHGAWQWWAGAVHHWRGSAEEHRARQRLTYLAESRGLGFLRSMGAAEHVRVLWELGRLRECVDLADAVDLADGAMPRWAVVQRALALADLGELDEATVDIVRTTPPADPGDLRHLAGTAAVAMHAALAVGDVAGARRALEFLGDLRPYVERDGAFELLPRLVRLALQADAADLVLDVDGIDRPPTPLRSHVATHVRGLQALARGDVDDARRLLEEAAQRWAAFGTVSEERAARAELARVLPA